MSKPSMDIPVLERRARLYLPEIQENRRELVWRLLEETKIQDSFGIWAFAFTGALQHKDGDGNPAPYMQGCQRFLRDNAVGAKASRTTRTEGYRPLRRIPAFMLRGWETERRFCYMPPGRETTTAIGHILLANKALLPFELLRRREDIARIRCTPGYHYRRVDGVPYPATTMVLSDDTTLIPDGIVEMALPDGRRVLILVEADNSTESIAMFNDGELDEKACLLGKMKRYESFRSDKDAYKCFEDEGEISSIIVMLLFQSAARMNRFKSACLKQFGGDVPWVWMTTRQDIDVDPRAFWLDEIWHTVSADKQPFALLDHNTLAINDFRLPGQKGGLDEARQAPQAQARGIPVVPARASRQLRTGK